MLSISFRERESLSITTDNAINGSTAIVVIDPNGDVIFVLGTDKNIKLLVSSKVLSVASKPFAAMFSTRFTESQGLSAAAPKEIPLPEDNAKAVTVFCKAIHHKIEDGDEPATTLELLEVVALVDKYDCTKLHSLKLWTKDLPCSLPNDAFALMVVSYIINDSKCFDAASMSLVCSQKPNELFIEWEKAFGGNYLPEGIWSLLEEKRLQIAHDIIMYPLRLVFHMFPLRQPSSYTPLSRTSNQGIDVAGETLRDALKRFWLDPGESIDYLLKELRWVMSCSDTPAQFGTRATDGTVIDVDLKNLAGNVLDEVAEVRGLCLACVRSVDAGGDLCSVHKR